MSIRSLFVALFFIIPSVLFGQGASDEVKASLVAGQSAVVPGQKFTVGLKLEHKEHWHSFWQNGGAYSQPTTIKWDLPPGFTAGEIIWPVPAAHPAEGEEQQIQHVYEGTVYLLTEFTAPSSLKPGDAVKLTAHVDMQTCTTGMCKQPKFDLPLNLTAAEKAEPVVAAVAAFNAVRKAQPVANAAWKTSVTAQEKSWVIRAEPGAGAAADPGTIYFFDAATATEPEAQDWKTDGKARVLTITALATTPKGQKPHGYLHAEKSWVEGAAVNNIIVGEATAPPGPDKPPVRQLPPPVPQEKPTVKEPTNDTSAPAADEDTLIAQILSWGVKEESLSWWLAILYAFLGGMILNLMPCVFPVLGIKILGFVKQAGEDHAAVKKHGLVYAAGVILSLMALAGVLLALRKAGETAGWGFQLQNPWFLVTLIVIVFGFSLSMAGVFEFGAKLTGVGSELQEQKGYRGSFFSGFLTVLLATPCTGPLMGPALGFALNVETPAVLVVVIFAALSAGLALPYVVLSWFPALVKKLPRPGAWMETFKQFMAFPMFATAVWLVTVFAGTTGEGGTAYILFALTIFAMVLWIYGRFFQRPSKPRSKNIAAVVAVLCVGSAGWLSAEAVKQKPAFVATVQGEEPLSARVIVERREKGLTTVVDFWAKWCLQCETNKKVAFNTDEFRAALTRYNAVFMVGDKTRKGSPSDVLSDKFLSAYKQGGIPYALVIPPKGPVLVIPSILTSPTPVIEKLQEAQKSN